MLIEHFGNADAVPQPPERCLSRQAGIVRCCLTPQIRSKSTLDIPRIIGLSFFSAVFSLITPVFFQAIGAAKVSVAISVMREIICLIPIFWLLSRLGLGGPGGRSRFPKPSPVSLVCFCICARSTVGRMCKKSGCRKRILRGGKNPLDIPVLILHNETSKRE